MADESAVLEIAGNAEEGKGLWCGDAPKERRFG
jgi:hypothetical protein